MDQNSGKTWPHNGEFHKRLSAINELILFECLYFKRVRGTFLQIPFNFLIAEIVA
jgi:hypothetical protein